MYARWAQFGLFSSHARCHGAPPREPWAYGDEAEAIFRRYDELRYRLMPYIYSEAVECGRSSLPMLRALVINYQDDPTTHTLEDQYLFGRDLLVAPILDEMNRRRVYLPHGRWIDYWRKETYAGGCWLDIEAPLEMMPLYVRAGAILPYGPLMQYVGQQPCDPLTIELYVPTAEGAYTIHDEAQPDIAIDYQREDATLIVNVDAAPGQVELILYGVAVTAARMEATPLAIDQLEDGGRRVTFDGSAARTISFEVE